jgi:hypothetical protein
VTRFLVRTTKKFRLKHISFDFTSPDRGYRSCSVLATYNPVGQQTKASPVWQTNISVLGNDMDHLSLTFNVTTRSNASSLDIFAEILFFRCSHHAEDAKRCKMTMLQSARKADGSTVGSKRRFKIIHAAWVQSTNLVCSRSHALTYVVAGELAIIAPV